MRDDKQILLASQRNAAEDDPSHDSIYRMGVLANVLQLLKLPDGTVKVLVEGRSRVRVGDYTDREEFFEASAEAIEEIPGDGSEMEALLRSVAREFERYAKIKKSIPEEALTAVAETREPARLADLVAGHLGIDVDRKQDLLETLAVVERLEKVLGLMQGEVSVLQVEKKIKTRVKSQMERTQREYYLNEQMKAIQRELGDGDEGQGEVAELEERIEATALSKEAREKADAELKKLKSMSPMSAEATVVRNYLDWMLSIPWGVKSRVKRDLTPRREGPRRRPLRSGEGQGADRRVPRGPAALAEAQGADPVPRGPAGRGQDLARQVRGAGDGARVHPHLARRRARRERDPRPPADLHRLDARQDHPGAEEGQDDQPVDPARRDRQDGSGLPRRPGVGHARGAGSGAELDLRRPLPRGGVRPLERDVPDDGQLLQHAGAAARPHGDHPARGLHRGREGRDRARAPHPQADQEPRPEEGGVHPRGRRSPGDDPPLHPRGRRAEPRARDRQDGAQGGHPDRARPHQARRGHAGQPRRFPGRDQVPLRARGGGRPDRRRDGAGPGRRSGATCSRSRPCACRAKAA